MGTRRIPVTVCNVPAFITGEVLASFHSAYGRVEETILLSSTTGTADEDYTFRLCLTREGFQAIPETIIGRERQMMVVLESRRPGCWGYKELGHIAKFCPPKTSRMLQPPQPPQPPQPLQPPSSVSSQPRRRKEKIRVRSSPKPTIVPKLM